MDIFFNCPHCEQELEVESTEIGREIECPSCGEKITIPAGKPETPEVNAIKTSAAAKEEVHLKVPLHDKPGEKLISKPMKTLEVAAKEGIHIRVKTIRRVDCMEVGRDHFDDTVSSFLDKVGEENIISVSPISYTTLDMATQKILTDFGVLIVYKG